MLGSFDVSPPGVLASWHSAMGILTVNMEKMSSAVVSSSTFSLAMNTWYMDAHVSVCVQCV